MKESIEELKLSLQREVCVMREILANMCLEEKALLFNDKKKWDVILQERALMIERLKQMRILWGEIHKPVEKNGDCHLTLLCEQIAALVERMNDQNIRNQSLLYQVSPQLELPMPQTPTQKSKTILATYPEETI